MPLSPYALGIPSMAGQQRAATNSAADLNTPQLQTETDRAAQMAQLGRLQTQSQFGDQAALGQLQSGIDANVAQQSALGLAGAQQQGLNRMDALQGMAGNQSMAQQAGRNQYGQLQAQTRQTGLDQYSALLGTIRKQDIAEASAARDAAAASEDARLAAQQQKDEQWGGLAKSFSPMGIPVGGLIDGLFRGGGQHYSSGGPVGGQPSRPGDSPQNDTVSAKLSPGEIVIPRSITQGPNAPQRAAEFVAAIQAQNQCAQGRRGGGYSSGGKVQRFAGGGPVAYDYTVGDAAGGVHSRDYRLGQEQEQLRKIAETQALGGNTVFHPGPADYHNANMMWADSQNAAGQYANAQAGHGPSATGYMQQQAMDENAAQAMAAQTAARGNQASLMNVGVKAGGVGQDISGAVGAARAQEIARVNQSGGQFLTQMRGQSGEQFNAATRANLRDWMVAQGIDAQRRAQTMSAAGDLARGATAAAGAYAAMPGSRNTPGQDVSSAPPQDTTSNTGTMVDAAWGGDGQDIGGAPPQDTSSGVSPMGDFGSGGDFAAAYGGMVPGLMGGQKQGRFAQGGEVMPPVRAAQMKHTTQRAEVQAEALARSQGKQSAGGQMKMLTDTLTDFYVKQGMSPQVAQQRALQAVGKGGK